MSTIDINEVVKKAEANREHSPTYCLEHDVPMLIESIRILQGMWVMVQKQNEELERFKSNVEWSL